MTKVRQRPIANWAAATGFSPTVNSKPMGSAAPDHEHVFNDDLLMTAGDVEHATSQFPTIIHVLDHPLLRRTFQVYEKEANHARDMVRRLGLTAVAAATLSLLAVTTKPLWPHGAWTQWAALTAELVGTLGAFIAAGGLWLGPWKRRWLESRLMTERLRQWYFQLLARRARSIVASCGGGEAVAGFEKQRDRWFTEFLKAHQGKLDEQLASLTSELGDGATWLHDPEPIVEDVDVLADVFRAYERLRFDRQYGFAAYKLKTSTDRPLWHFLKWPPICQIALLSSLTSACFVGAIICSVVLVYGDVFGIDESIELIVRTAAVSVALVGVALRTVQNGLASDQEIDQYRDYRAKTAQLRDRFKHAADVKERFHLMGELELAAVDGLRAFLRTHQKSTFLLN